MQFNGSKEYNNLSSEKFGQLARQFCFNILILVSCMEHFQKNYKYTRDLPGDALVLLG